MPSQFWLQGARVEAGSETWTAASLDQNQVTVLEHTTIGNSGTPTSQTTLTNRQGLEEHNTHPGVVLLATVLLVLHSSTVASNTHSNQLHT